MNLEALADAYEKESLRKLAKKQQFRDSDAVPYPAKALEKLLPEFQKVSGAKRMAQHLRRSGTSQPASRYS